MQFTISNNAAEFIKNTIPENHFLRVAILGGGCSGFSYHYTITDKKEEGDILFEEQQAKVLINKNFTSMLNQSILEYRNDIGNKGFNIKNPQTTANCGCGKSFNV